MKMLDKVWMITVFHHDSVKVATLGPHEHVYEN